MSWKGPTVLTPNANPSPAALPETPRPTTTLKLSVYKLREMGIEARFRDTEDGGDASVELVLGVGAPLANVDIHSPGYERLIGEEGREMLEAALQKAVTRSLVAALVQ